MQSANKDLSGRGGRGRLAVVSGYALNPMAPRGQRTRRLLESLDREWETELIALPAETFAGSGAPLERRAWWRRLAGAGVSMALLDKWEPWALGRLGRWRPDVDAALLIGYPWSPVAHAARRLVHAGIPFAVDAGDPWVLTAPEIGPRLVARLRSRSAESSMWRHAAGAVMTTDHQRDVLLAQFPHLPILVRPNGYEPLPQGSSPSQRPAARDPERLRLVHYGALSELRIDVNELLSALVESGRWRSISFAQFGDDRAGALRGAPAGVEVERHAERPWAEVLATASVFDLAIVVGNTYAGQLPSKAIQYMTLPIPRLALSTRETDDALANYVDGRPGWLAVRKGDPDAARRVVEHVGRAWSAEELAPPPEEAWPAVADRIANFLVHCLGASGARSPEPGRERRPPMVGRSA